MQPGTRVGRYEITSALGAGGMGEVYRARDTTLGRDVAIKILPEAVAGAPDRIMRFEREAKALAALNHPNIAQIYGVEESNGIRAIAMELVEGPTLAERMLRGRVGIDEALSIGSQIAKAMQTPHEQGIIHRDLKPANVKLRPDGVVKVLDFGLAKLEPSTSSLEVDTLTLPTPDAVSRDGLIVGTPAYMSPEQARGLPTDRRTDIWAFGCVLYELLTGRPAFAGRTRSDTLASVLTSAPDLTLMPSATPPGIVQLVRRCLQKDVMQRLQHIGDARLEIDDAIAAKPATDSAPTKSRRPYAAALVLLTGLVLAVAVLLLVRWTDGSRAGSSSVFHLSLALPANQILDAGPSLAIDHAGRRIAYVADRNGIRGLFVRDLAGTESRLLPGTDDAWMPFFSPDDESIGFFANEKLKRIDVAGGIPSTLCDAPDGRGGSWGTNDMIVFAPTTHSALMQVSAHGGIPTPLTTIDSQSGESGHRWPQLLPDNRAVIFAAGPSMTMSNFNEGQLVVQSLKTGERHVLVDRGTYPKYLSTGHLAYVANDAVFARPFDLQRLEVTGPPVPVLADVAEGAAGQKPVDISATGTVVYSPGSSNTQRSLFLVDANGTAKPLPLAADRFEYPLVSPDGRLLAVAIVGGQDTDIWVYDVASGGRTPLTSGGVNKPLAWTRDGHHVAYASSRGAAESIYWRRADGSEPEQRLAAGTGMPVGASFAAGDRAIVFDAFRGEKGADVLKLPLPASGPPVPLSAASLSNAQDPQISPDGELLAYALARPERTDIFVRSLSSDGVVAQVSLDGGVSPRWAHSGRELFFLDDGVLMAVAVVTKPALTVSRPHRVMPHPSGNELTFAAVDVLPGDRKFIALEPDRASNFHDIGVIVNWFEELKATMAPR